MFMYLFTGVSNSEAYFSVPVCHVERMEYLKVALKLWSKSLKKKEHYFEYVEFYGG